MSGLNIDRIELQIGAGGEKMCVERKMLAKRLKLISQAAKIIGRRPGEPCVEGGGMSLEWAHTIMEAKMKYNSTNKTS
jgi:hypothetical protein